MAKFREDIKFQCEFFERLAERCENNLQVLQRLGALYSSAGRIEDGLRIDIQASLLAPDNQFVHYNLACDFALLGQHEFAIDHLRLAIKLGFDDVEQMQNDNDLRSLHNSREFKSLVRELNQKS
jgi:tetratricopeptide (TPR) repeat protein